MGKTWFNVAKNWIILLQLDLKQIHKVNFYPSDNNFTQALLVCLWQISYLCCFLWHNANSGPWYHIHEVDKSLFGVVLKGTYKSSSIKNCQFCWNIQNQNMVFSNFFVWLKMHISLICKCLSAWFLHCLSKYCGNFLVFSF